MPADWFWPQPNQRLQLAGAARPGLRPGAVRRWRTADRRIRDARARRPQLNRKVVRPQRSEHGPPMRLASRALDYWELRLADESHRAHAETFWIPPLEQRQSLRRGQAVKLIFDIEGIEPDGSVVAQGQRMWVLVTERLGDTYVGILDNEPALEPAENVYLRKGAEIPFRAEHVADIADPPDDYAAERLATRPSRRWPRH
jgi:hypothetical protein